MTISNRNMWILAGAISISLVLPTAAAAAEPDGAALWAKNCAKCHGKTGKGDTKVGKKAKVADYTDPAFQAKYKDEELLKAVKEGQGEADADGERAMPKYDGKLTEAEQKATVAFIRTMKP